VSVSNRKVNSINFWRCATTITRRFIIASAWELLFFCPVKSGFALILLSLNFFNQQLYNKHENYLNVSLIEWLCGVRRRHYFVSRDKFQRCHWPFLALRALRNILLKQFSLCCVAYVACVGWKPGLSACVTAEARELNFR